MTKTKENTTDSHIKHEFKFRYIFVFTFYTLLIFALFSHNKGDLAIIEGGEIAGVSNWVGQIGAITSKNLLYLFGLGAYPITIILMISGIRPFLHIETHRKGYLSILIAIIFGITLLAGMCPETFCGTTDQLGIGHSAEPLKALSGGVIGQQLAGPMDGNIQAGIIRHLIGTIGTATFASILLLTGLAFLYISDWHMIVMSLYKNFKENNLEC